MDETAPTALPQTIPYHLAERIRRGIIRGRYQPGASLREQDLSAEFGSSRGPVREALRLLEQQGLVSHAPRRGFRVKALTEADIRSIYALRSLLEGRAVEGLAERDVAPLVERLSASNERMRQFVAAALLDEYFDENMRFHQTMIDYTHDQPLIRVLSILSEMAMPIRYTLIARKFPDGNDYAYHKEITALIAAGQFAAARILTAEHISMNVEAAVRAFARPAEPADEQPSGATLSTIDS